MPIDPAKLTEARKAAGITSAEAARRAGMLRRNWHRIESGKRPNPTLQTAEAVAKAVGVGLEQILRK
jgi:transcriptional regulator with XRE-family HTH domain